jgi:hypothetical protein
VLMLAGFVANRSIAVVSLNARSGMSFSTTGDAEVAYSRWSSRTLLGSSFRLACVTQLPQLGLRPHDFVSLRFVVSHPFARKKAKGWGTEMVQEQAVTDLAARYRRSSPSPNLPRT